MTTHTAEMLPETVDASDRDASAPLDAQQRALLELGRRLRASGYRHVTVTPETHRRVLARTGPARAGLRDALGWSRPFARDAIPADALALLERAGAIEHCGAQLRSRVRWSTLDDLLLVHSAYPTLAADAVFFGPDTYRFGELVQRALTTRHHRVRHLVDVGCGSGAGGLLAAHMLDVPAEVTLADINPQALRLAAVNAALNGVPHARALRSDLLGAVQPPIDLVLCNPPYLCDPSQRAYRHGGGALGCALALRVVSEALARLAPGGRLVLYTGSPMVDGQDTFFDAARPLLQAAGAQWQYREIDPDVFGEELDAPAYARVERIAAVGLIAQMPGGDA
ncbi:MAG TPA: class I SAM-dependent methyltransferase [Nevskiaceae bacterium]|nr:class I SAM-dependent methyltransferase [Nevskiaceae bacterium]